MDKKTYPIIDIAKFISAILVVAIHTAPFSDISDTANLVYVQILGRMAVPFFFVASGFLLFRHFDLRKDLYDRGNLRYLVNYIKRIMKIYLIWSLIYLPLTIYGWMKADFSLMYFIRILRDFLFVGSYYHLWFLPALMLGACLVYFLIFRFGIKKTCITVFSIYIVGMFMNLYAPAILEVPFLAKLMDIYNMIFYTSRNGLFFGGIYIFLGAAITYADVRLNKKQSLTAFLISFPLLIIEVILIEVNGFMYPLASMYLMLAPTVFFLFQYLLTIPVKERNIYKILRRLSLLMYVSHVVFSTVYANLFPEVNSFLYYLITLGSSIILAEGIFQLSKKVPVLKNLY